MSWWRWLKGWVLGWVAALRYEDPPKPAPRQVPIDGDGEMLDTDTTEETMPGTSNSAPAVIGPREREVIESVVSVFETGSPERTASAYATLVVLDDGAGISYGKHQSTDHSGSLDAICAAYVTAGGREAVRVQPHLERLAVNGTVGLEPHTSGPPWPGSWPSWVSELATALHDAGSDPAMHAVQDAVFADRYWKPAAAEAEAMGLVHPLSWAVIYDTAIHNGVSRISKLRQKFPEVPPSNGGDEQAWLRSFLRARRDYVLGLNTDTKRKSAVRCDALMALCERDLWALAASFNMAAPTGWGSRLEWKGTASLFGGRWPYHAVVTDAA